MTEENEDGIGVWYKDAVKLSDGSYYIGDINKN